MTRSAARDAALALAALTLAAISSFAQTPETTMPPEQQRALAARSAAAAAAAGLEGPLVSVNFPGGTVADYVAALRAAAAPAPANVAVSEEMATVRLPAIRLDKVSIFSALRVIEAIAPQQPGRQWQVRSYGSPAPDGAAALAYSISITPAGISPAGPAAPPQLLRTLAMREVVGDGPGAVKVETALTAVETALSMIADPASKFDLKFHPESFLLFVHGSPQHVEAASAVLSQLRDARRAELAHAEERVRAQSAREVQAAELQMRRGLLATRLESARQGLLRAEELHRAGTISNDELRRAELAVAELSEQLAVVELRLTTMREDPHGHASGHAIDSLHRRIAELERENAELRAKLEAVSRQPRR